ncbi:MULTISPECIES: DUF6161 domain-containing protein [unclassified Devosia]|uniref:DUF6161 domain-containing protein n=1 Tax=unclassified Devosia TaxID=196773 RepID=UPI00145D60BE|nr:MULTISPECIES: DUF6161 domain-containing protein [unclassified Devosia]MBJ6986829.1 hypothetical protein [Devosia sp. MC521]QMW63862.1 hypothetical protein H4N61_05945 [Devosia sp. MC521]
MIDNAEHVQDAPPPHADNSNDSFLHWTSPRQWIERELELWNALHARVRKLHQMSPLAGDTLLRYETLFSAYHRFYSAIGGASETDLPKILDEQVRTRQIAVLHGHFGKTIKELIHAAPLGILLALEALTAKKWLPEKDELASANTAVEIQLYSSLTLDSIPNAFNQQDLYLLDIGNRFGELVSDIEAAKKAASTGIAAQQKELVNWIGEQKVEISALHEAYHTKLSVDTPATFWKNKAASAEKTSRKFLSLFFWLVGAALPLAALLVWQLWPELKVVSQSGSSIPFGLVAALLIPTLGYAWIRKQVSRVFLINRAIADDASYREVMTMTYLGLVKDVKSEITKEERGLILNALFRPTPASTQDDGPPTGIFDLLNGKKP